MMTSCETGDQTDQESSVLWFATVILSERPANEGQRRRVTGRVGQR